VLYTTRIFPTLVRKFTVFLDGHELAELRLARGLNVPFNIPESSSLPDLFNKSGLDIIESENYSTNSYFPPMFQ
jgi:hypothetical protein